MEWLTHQKWDLISLYKLQTFSTPHGGGGPGAGPVAVNDKLADFLPNPIIECKDEKFYFQHLENSIGKVHTFNGNYGVLLRLMFICYHLVKS